mmetsp:Transcript_9222/g.15343  ORF Transcript_9222/g.15343 Transcript_9222/m.15343 type:complete len:130 (-) Transcript_9222:60-449(-)
MVGVRVGSIVGSGVDGAADGVAVASSADGALEPVGVRVTGADDGEAISKTVGLEVSSSEGMGVNRTEVEGADWGKSVDSEEISSLSSPGLVNTNTAPTAIPTRSNRLNMLPAKNNRIEPETPAPAPQRP